jgi:hypothetical protein
VTLGATTLAVSNRRIEDRGPLVQVVSPRRLILATTPSHIVRGPIEATVRVWSHAPVSAVEMRVNSGEWQSMVRTRADIWSRPIAGHALPKGAHTLDVRATDANGDTGQESITFAVDITGRFNPVPAVDPVVTSTKFC